MADSPGTSDPPAGETQNSFAIDELAGLEQLPQTAIKAPFPQPSNSAILLEFDPLADVAPVPTPPAVEPPAPTPISTAVSAAPTEAQQPSPRVAEPSPAPVASPAPSNMASMSPAMSPAIQAEPPAPAAQHDPHKFSIQKFKENLDLPEAAPVRARIEKFLNELRGRVRSVQQISDMFQDFLDSMDAVIVASGLWPSDIELENAREGLEKHVMQKLCRVVFSQPSTDDASRDEILRHRLALFKWVKENHLDIPSHPQNEENFADAMSELLKMNKYRAPRDKFICILNCIKVLNSQAKRIGVESSADIFLPLLIYTLIHANVPHLISNIQYIERFRGRGRLKSEAEYYFTLLSSAVQFLETMDAASLNIPPAEFDRLMEERMKEMETESPLKPLVENHVALAPSEHDEAAGPLAAASAAISAAKALFSPRTPVLTEPQASPVNAKQAPPKPVLTPSTPVAVVPQVPAGPPSPEFVHSLTKKDKELLEDYDLQLAMALSLSETERKAAASMPTTPVIENGEKKN